VVLGENGSKPGFMELARNTIRRVEEVGLQEGPKIEITD
jgi:hypothetical protein